MQVIKASVRELSLHGCYVDTPAPFSPQTPVLVKIFKLEESFEAKATVIYANSTLGMGLAFSEVKPGFRSRGMRTVDLFRAKPAEPGEYFILDQVTGQVYIQAASRNEHPAPTG